MREFTFVLEREPDIKSVGALVEEAAGCTSDITIHKGEKAGNAKLIFNVLSLSLKPEDEVTVSVEGEKEQAEAEGFEEFVKQWLTSTENKK
ncbi:MAG: HPr family phosphocarrier protein [Eubacteriales bacterium]|nr:HPr family phosphocarrier protein [Eubacteriales bacterium]